MEKRNFKFLDGILFVLGSRKKHPWGESLGFKNARITSIFNGVPPTADGLSIIHLSEKVRIEWLIAGIDCAPFAVCDLTGDNTHKNILEADEVFLCTDTDRNYFFVVTNVKTFKSEKIETSYKDILILRDKGLLTSRDLGTKEVKLITLNNNHKANEFLTGHLGPVHLLPYLDKTDKPVLINKVIEQLIENDINSQYQNSPFDISLQRDFISLNEKERQAIKTITKSMANHNITDVLQHPPKGVINPDLNTESQPVTVDVEPTPPN